MSSSKKMYGISTKILSDMPIGIKEGSIIPKGFKERFFTNEEKVF